MKFIIRKKQENVYELIRVLDNNEEILIRTGELRYCVSNFRAMGVPESNLEIIN